MKTITQMTTQQNYRSIIIKTLIKFTWTRIKEYYAYVITNVNTFRYRVCLCVFNCVCMCVFNCVCHCVCNCLYFIVCYCVCLSLCVCRCVCMSLCVCNFLRNCLCNWVRLCFFACFVLNTFLCFILNVWYYVCVWACVSMCLRVSNKKI